MLAISPKIDPEVDIGAIVSPMLFLLVFFMKGTIVKMGIHVSAYVNV